MYRWTIDGGVELYGYNPKSYTFGIGSHRIALRVFDEISGAIADRTFLIRIEKLLTAKKPKNHKKPKPPKVTQSKTWNAREIRSDTDEPAE